MFFLNFLVGIDGICYFFLCKGYLVKVNYFNIQYRLVSIYRSTMSGQKFLLLKSQRDCPKNRASKCIQK